MVSVSPALGKVAPSPASIVLTTVGMKRVAEERKPRRRSSEAMSGLSDAGLCGGSSKQWMLAKVS